VGTPTRRVFISYSHDSDQHRASVLAFAQRLRREGVDAWLLLRAGVIVCTCTDTWGRRYAAVKDEGSDTGDQGLVIPAPLGEVRKVGAVAEADVLSQGVEGSAPNDALSVAKIVTKAIRERDSSDSSAMLEYLTPDEARASAQLLSEKPDHWWTHVIESADEADEVRYEYDRLAHARCGPKIDDDEYYFVIELALLYGEWRCSDFGRCRVDEWSSFASTPPDGDTVLEVLESCQPRFDYAMERLSCVLAALPEAGSVEPVVTSHPLDPPLVVADFSHREQGNVSIVSERAARTARQRSNYEEDSNPLSVSHLAMAMYWVNRVNQSNWGDVHWIKEKGRWRDPTLRARLESMLTPQYLVVHRVVAEGTMRAPLAMEGIVFEFETAKQLASYTVTVDVTTRDALFRRTKEALWSALNTAVGDSVRVLGRAP